MTVLVTGGTGTLGRALVPLLDEPRVLSRRAAPGLVRGDLATGDGLPAALQGVDVVIHAATRPRGDADDARRLVDAARRAGSPHVLLISIVGVDRVPLGYYREKLGAEEVVAGSGLPWTILRTTQFHELLAGLFTTVARTGLLAVLAGTSFQPVAVGEVAARLAALAAVPAQGRVADLGGPDVRPVADLARAWRTAHRRRLPIMPVRLPGAVAGALRDGGHLCPEHAEGVGTFEEALRAQ